jgi:hypothetical protein
MAKRTTIFEDERGAYRTCIEANDRALGEPFVYLELNDCFFETRSMGGQQQVCVRLSPELAKKLGLMDIDGKVLESSVESQLQTLSKMNTRLQKALDESLEHLKRWVPTNPFEEEEADVRAVDRLRISVAQLAAD